MKLSAADKLALIFTGAGSQRAVAALVGLSHQTIGRILHAQMRGDTATVTRYETRLDVVGLVDTAFDQHAAKARQAARAQGIPYVPGLPIHQARMQRQITDPKTGEIFGIPGDRVHATHMHWLSDRLRSEWIKGVVKSQRYANLTVRSKVKLRDYLRKAKQRADEKLRTQGLYPSDKAITSAEILRKALAQHEEIKDIYLPRRVFSRGESGALVANAVERDLQQRHAPSTGEEGTTFADSIYLQLDTRKIISDAEQKLAKLDAADKLRRAKQRAATKAKRKGKSGAPRRHRKG